MPYSAELQELFNISGISQLEPRLTAIQRAIEQALQSFTNAELILLLNHLFKLKPMVSEHPFYEKQLDALINQIHGNKKSDFVDGPVRYPQLLSVDDMVIISEHYRLHGMRIFIENRLSGIPNRQFLIKGNLQTAQLLGAYAIEEMLNIQQTLKDGEYVGYIYTNNVTTGNPEHFEAFIIGKNTIIKPIFWNVSGKTLDLDLYGIVSSRTDLNSFCGQTSLAQAGTRECGALSISYLKNYLKDNARLLHEFTLSIPYYLDGSRAPKYFHFPAPDVLRYSQSNSYNRCFEAMLKPEGDRWVHDGKEYSIKSLRQVLEEALAKAILYEDTETIAQLQSIRLRLPAFSERWLKAYQVLMHKHQSMQTETYNRYLSYTLQRMNLIADKARQAVSNPGLSLLRRLDALLAASTQTADIILVLKRELTTIPFQAADEIGYFFGKLPNTYYFEVLDELATMLKQIGDFHQCTLFLSPVQIFLLIDHIKKPENFYRILVLRNKTKLEDLSGWLSSLRIQQRDGALFLSDRLARSWLTHELKCLVLDKKLHYLSGVFPSQIEFSRFLQTYITFTDIAELVPKLFVSRGLSTITPWFETRNALQAFVREHLDIVFMQRTLLGTENQRYVYFIIQSYIKLFDKEEASTILFNTIGPDVLVHLLGEPRWFYELVNDHCTIGEITVLFFAHSDLLLKGMINKKSIYPLNDHEKLRSAIINGLAFFCPRDNEEIMALYREMFRDISKFNNPTNIFLADILSFLPVDDRWAFIDSIFTLGQIEKLKEIVQIAHFLPERAVREDIEHVLSHVSGVSNLTPTVVPASASGSARYVAISALVIGVGIGLRMVGFFSSSNLRPVDPSESHQPRNTFES